MKANKSFQIEKLEVVGKLMKKVGHWSSQEHQSSMKSSVKAGFPSTHTGVVEVASLVAEYVGKAVE